jgi:hypothetical protein
LNDAMLRALLFFALALGVVVSGLLLLRRTAGQPPADGSAPSTPRIAKEDRDEDDSDTW